MKNLKKSHLVLIAVSILILLGCIGLTAFLLFSNYQNVRIFKSARSNLAQGSAESLRIAEAQLLQVVSQDADNEAAYMMLAQIAAQRKAYSEQVYYSYMAHRLNPLSEKNKAVYIKSLSMARYFDRLENFLAQQQELSDEFYQLLLYAAGHNGNINKYKHKLARRGGDNRVAELAFLLFKYKHLSADKKLSALQNNFSGSENAFLRQELLAARVELYLAKQDIDNAEKALQQACKLNEFAFAPVLGRFYAEYRTFGRALQIFEKYLADYHAPMVAMQTAEIYCLLNQTAKIAELRKDFQADTGNLAMFCCYYFDALTALAQGDMAALKELTVPLRKSIKTPLAAYMFFCSDLYNSDLSAVQTSYAEFLACKPYLDLQKRADDMLSAYLKKSFAAAPEQAENLLPSALMLYQRKPELFTAKLILLIQKKSGNLDIKFLKDALKLFSKDQGLFKIAIEYFLHRDPKQCGKLIDHYRKNFPAQRGDMLRYEIVLGMKNKDYNRVSALFQANLAPEILPEYWTFASTLMREDDLRVIGKDKLYEPFCNALLLIKKGNKKAACDILENADAKNNYALLFFAAKTLGENGRNQAALDKYQLFPEKSPYQLTVLLNMAELFAENGNLPRSVSLARQAYELAPTVPEVQLCYADKLYKNGHLTEIPDVVKLVPHTAQQKRMEFLWIAGMQQRIRQCDINKQRERLRELCRQLLVLEPGNTVALEHLKQLNKMPQ